jgi:hypothetical protein
MRYPQIVISYAKGVSDEQPGHEAVQRMLPTNHAHPAKNLPRSAPFAQHHQYWVVGAGMDSGGNEQQLSINMHGLRHHDRDVR